MSPQAGLDVVALFWETPITLPSPLLRTRCANRLLSISGRRPDGPSRRIRRDCDDASIDRWHRQSRCAVPRSVLSRGAGWNYWLRHAQIVAQGQGRRRGSVVEVGRSLQAVGRADGYIEDHGCELRFQQSNAILLEQPAMERIELGIARDREGPRRVLKPRIEGRCAAAVVVTAHETVRTSSVESVLRRPG